jgi:DNA-binding NarL/FixJ family response regulator
MKFSSFVSQRQVTQTMWNLDFKAASTDISRVTGDSMRIGLIADDDAYFRVAVSAILRQKLHFADVLEAESLDEAFERLQMYSNVSAALFDLSMPGMNAPAALRTVRESFPEIRVGVISGSNSRRDILMALEAGVHGYMPKSLSIAELTKALQAIFDGGLYVPPLLADITIGTLPAVTNVPEHFERDKIDSNHILTRRQQEVLDLLVQGKSNKEIALALNLSEGTVKIHLTAIFRHFGVSNRAAAAVAGARPTMNGQRLIRSH